MKKSMKIELTIIAIIVLTFGFLFLSINNKRDIEVANDEISLRIQLDTREDIGLIIIDYSTDDESGIIGIGNADKSMLKHNDLVIENFTKENFENPSDIKKLTLQFKVITDCTEPNMDFDYPKEYTKILDPISLEAEFGESYNIIISGDKTNGYKAVLEE